MSSTLKVLQVIPKLGYGVADIDRERQGWQAQAWAESVVVRAGLLRSRRGRAGGGLAWAWGPSGALAGRAA